jgi:hydrogenase maturation protein HypF
MTRYMLTLSGVVQGVGMRPYVFQLAHTLGIVGWVRNSGSELTIDAQGNDEQIVEFITQLRKCPQPAHVEDLIQTRLEDRPTTVFEILESTQTDCVLPTLPSDLASCSLCLQEIAEPEQRWYRYPFTNCTHCGPRYTIVESLPYDRIHTAMSGFSMCPECNSDYNNPRNRRFHAQPIACPKCGPTLELLSRNGRSLATGEQALLLAGMHLQDHKIIALKGLGGFQLMALGTRIGTIEQLRIRKQRPRKPIAIMFADLSMLQKYTDCSVAAIDQLTSASSPIVLLPKSCFATQVGDENLAVLWEQIAPCSPWLGVMLANTPLHHLLVQGAGVPLLCTSGNVAEQPMVTTTEDALEALGNIADFFLTHDRPIVRPVDDSLLFLRNNDAPVMIRRARGFVPQSLTWKQPTACVLALGGQLKNTLALTLPSSAHGSAQVVVSQHIGDLNSFPGRRLLETTVHDFLQFFRHQPQAVICDLHPDYGSTQLAETVAIRWNIPCLRIQHHHAHVATVLAEFGEEDPVLGIVWDGLGRGTDDLWWGGEFLLCHGTTYVRKATLFPFRLLGGVQALRSPRRVAYSLLKEVSEQAAEHYARQTFSPPQCKLLPSLFQQAPFSPLTSSMGRLFDGISAMMSLCLENTYEGEAASCLESKAGLIPTTTAKDYPFAILDQGDEIPWQIDWRPMVKEMWDDICQGQHHSAIAMAFHCTIQKMAINIAQRVGIEKVALSGGCFQNSILLNGLDLQLTQQGFSVLIPRLYPVNDGGLALGQAWLGSRMVVERERH